MSSRLRSLNSTKISFFAFQDIITSVSGILILVTLILATELDRPTNKTTTDADLELERELSETLRRQAEVDAQNETLQSLLSAVETAPDAGKLEGDIARLRAQLADERKKHASIAEQLASIQSTIEARDRTLGLTDLKAQIQRIILEVESLAREESKVRDEMTRLDQRVAGVQSKLLTLRQREGKLWLIPDKSSTSKEPILAVISGSGAKLERFDHPEDAREFTKASARADFGSYLNTAQPVNQYFVFLVRPSGIELFDSLVKLARDRGFEVGFDALEENKDVYFTTPPVPDDTPPPPPNTASQYRPGSGGYSNPRGGAGDVTSSTSVPRGKGTNNNSSGGSKSPQPSVSSTDHTNQTSTSKQSMTLPSTAHRSLWQRFLEWLGFASSKGSSGQSGVGNNRSDGTSTKQGSVAAANPGSTSPEGASPQPVRPGTSKPHSANAGKGGGSGAGTGNGTGGAAVAPANVEVGAGAGSPGQNPNRSGDRDRSGTNSHPAATNAGEITNAASVRATKTNAPTFAESKTNTPPPVTQPKRSPSAKGKSWWQRFLEWIGLK